MKTISTVFMVTLILVGALTMAFNIQLVKAAGTIHIRADGSIDPPTAPVVTVDNVTYTLTGNVTSDADGIVVERSNIVVDGASYTLQGLGFGSGFYWSGVNNVTIKNTNIRGFRRGIYLWQSSCSSISGNNITANTGWGIWLNSSSGNIVGGNTLTNDDDGILLDYSSGNIVSGNTLTANTRGVILHLSDSNSVSENNVTANDHGVWLGYGSTSNSVSGNNITANKLYGMLLDCCDENSISGNAIEANTYGGISSYLSDYNSVIGNAILNNNCGIHFSSSSSNRISGNKIADNMDGVWLGYSSGNRFYHNNFIDNNQQVRVHVSGYANVWDDGYPSGGNFWSNYTGADVKSGSSQNQPGSDGIGDTLYVVDSDNQDRYPLMKPYPWDPHDIGIAPLDVSKTVVDQGHTLHGNVTVYNYGNNTETFNLTVYANTTIIHTSETILLASSDSLTIALTWNTTGLAKGNYMISAQITQVPGETDLSDNIMDARILVTIPGDVNGDREVDIFDIVKMAGVYGVKLPDPRYEPNCDIDDDSDIDIFDIVLAAGYYGQSW